MIVIDIDDEDDEDETLAGFMPLYLDNGMDSSRDILSNQCKGPRSEVLI